MSRPRSRKSNSFSFYPSIGFVIKENRVFGIFLAYSRNRNENNGYPPGKALSYGGGIFIREYMGLGKGFYLFGQGDLGYMHYSQEQGPSNSEITSKSNTASLNVYPGISYAVSKKFHFELLLSNISNFEILNYTNHNLKYERDWYNPARDLL